MGRKFTVSNPSVRKPQQQASTRLFGAGIPRIQILTIAELLDGKKPDMPLVDVGAAFRPAPRERREGEQQELTI
jgi:hypothetical protein